MKSLIMLALFGGMISAGSALAQANKTVSKPITKSMTEQSRADGLQLATFGSGCFWCTEAIFQNVDGVIKVESGYSGGKVKNPSYREVCTGQTGHAEVTQLTYDPKKVSLWLKKIKLFSVFP